MTKSFEKLFEESLKSTSIVPGSIVQGTIISIKKDTVLVDANLKSESSVPIEQFFDSHGKLEIKIGDKVDLALDAIEDGSGETLLSREKAKKYESWANLEKAYRESNNIVGVIDGKVKGGFTVELNGIRAFLPGSLVDARPVRDILHLEGKELEFKVIKLDQKRNNVVVSRRAVIESEIGIEKVHLVEKIKEGETITGIVKNLTDYGAFIDLGGIDGLLHITDMAWKRISHPNKIVQIGDEITVKVLKFDRDRNRVSLGLKQLSEDPWISIANKYPEGSILEGSVTNLTEYGCFVELEDGVEGLVHVSEMDWTNKNIHPSKVVAIKEKVKIMVLDIDTERRRISLGIKQCRTNPWKKFYEKYKRGDEVKGKIKSITDFGIFIGLEGGIDGLVHLSDISWNLPGEEAVKEYKKGEEISSMVLQIDPVRERISLGIKQLMEDPFFSFLSENKPGKILNGTIVSNEKNGIIVNLLENIEGYLDFSDIPSSTSPDQIKLIYQIGDKILVKIIGFDKKNRLINLALCANEEINEVGKESDKKFEKLSK